MAEERLFWYSIGFWIKIVALVILLIFLYFFQPFEQYIIENVPRVRFHRVIFWFAALVGVIGFALSHWQSFRRHILHSSGRIKVEELAFDTLQISLLTSVIISAGATLQAVEMLAEFLLFQEMEVEQTLGERILTILFFIILTIGFYLLHMVVRAFRKGWQPRRPPPRSPSIGP